MQNEAAKLFKKKIQFTLIIDLQQKEISFEKPAVRNELGIELGLIGIRFPLRDWFGDLGEAEALLLLASERGEILGLDDK